VVGTADEANAALSVYRVKRLTHLRLNFHQPGIGTLAVRALDDDICPGTHAGDPGVVRGAGPIGSSRGRRWRLNRAGEAKKEPEGGRGKPTEIGA
jgi:hypothetical protein